MYAVLTRVSIRPRPGSRGKQVASGHALATIKFQSAPGRAAGGNMNATKLTVDLYQVSIRPRPGSRGKP